MLLVENFPPTTEVKHTTRSMFFPLFLQVLFVSYIVIYIHFLLMLVLLQMIDMAAEFAKQDVFVSLSEQLKDA